MTYSWNGTDRLDEPSPEVCWGVRGTYRGYYRHKRAGERPCDKCREAHNAYHRAQKKGSRRKIADNMRARTRAWRALARRHPEEYQSILRSELSRVIGEAAA